MEALARSSLVPASRAAVAGCTRGVCAAYEIALHNPKP